MPKASAFPLFWNSCVLPLIPTPQQTGVWKKRNLGCWVLPAAPCPGSTLRRHTKESWSFWRGNGEGAECLGRETCLGAAPPAPKSDVQETIGWTEATACKCPGGPFSTFCSQAALRISLPWEILCLDKKILGEKTERKAKKKHAILQV